MRRLQLSFWMLMGLVLLSPAQEAPPPDIAVAALYQACVDGDMDMVKTLVESGAPINGQTGPAGFTPLIGAVNGRFDILTYLISKHANLDIADYEGSTPLAWACHNDKTDIALALIKAGANVNAPSNSGRTALMWAAMRGNDAIVSAMIAHKVNLNANGSEGSAAVWAVSTDKLSTLKLLVAAGARLDLMPDETGTNPVSLLGRAAMSNDLDLVNFLIDQKVDIDAAGETGNTALMIAASLERTKVLEKLLDQGAKVDLQNNEGDTALMMGRGSDTTQILLHNHANIELKTGKGMTALMIAARWSNTKRVITLIDGGADINATDARGETALTIAGDVGGYDVVQLLKDNGAKRTDVHIIAKNAPAESLSPAQDWALAVGAIFFQREGLNPRVLGGGDTTGLYPRMLKSWNVSDKANFLSVLNEIRDVAHQASNQNQVRMPTTMTLNNPTDPASNLMAEETAKRYGDLMAAHPSATLFPGKSATGTDYLNDKGRRGLASALCRSVNLINAGFSVHYLTEQEAWDRLIDIAQLAQGNFDSWQELSSNFLEDRLAWGVEYPYYNACAQLLLDPKEALSPWNQNPWKTDLSASTSLK